MDHEITILAAAAASIGLCHTLFGPDHYVPFIVMSKAGKWSPAKTIWITIASGFGHVGSSVVLGLVGVLLGLGVNRLSLFEEQRGSLAAWLLIAFGLVYMVWGMRWAYRNKKHAHIHVHQDGTFHDHVHAHQAEHVHGHSEDPAKQLTPWILFTIFVLGPCEPLIPLVMYPAARHSMAGVLVVTAVFGGITIVTMVGVVALGSCGIRLIAFGKLERFTHALAGGTILLSGLAIELLGL